MYVEAFPEWTRTAGIETADEVRSRGPAVVKHALAEVAARPDRKRPVFLEVVLIDAHAPREYRLPVIEYMSRIVKSGPAAVTICAKET